MLLLSWISERERKKERKKRKREKMFEQSIGLLWLCSINSDLISFYYCNFSHTLCLFDFLFFFVFFLFHSVLLIACHLWKWLDPFGVRQTNNIQRKKTQPNKQKKHTFQIVLLCTKACKIDTSRYSARRQRWNCRKTTESVPKHSAKAKKEI